MNRLGAVVIGAVLLAALFAWYVKGDLEMAWLWVGPTIVGVTLLLVGMGSVVTLPPGFPRFAAALAGLPFGILLAWAAASTTNTVPVPPAPERMAEARRMAADTERLERVARQTLGAPIAVGGALVDSTDGYTRKVSGRFGLERRDPRVRIIVSFAVGPREPLRLEVTASDALEVIETVPSAGRTILRPDAVLRRYPDTPLVEVGGSGPFAPGQAVPMRLMRGEDDWSIEVVRVLAEGQPLAPVRTLDRAEIVDAVTATLRAGGDRPSRIASYFQPAGARVLFMNGPSFDFQTPLAGGGFATVRASLRADTMVFERVTYR